MFSNEKNSHFDNSTTNLKEALAWTQEWYSGKLPKKKARVSSTNEFKVKLLARS